MQLKTVGESLNVVNDIENVLNNTSNLKGLSAKKETIRQLVEATASYSTEAVKAAIAESTLNKEQIKAILSKQGLTGETLKTTTAELAQVTSTNALATSQEAATGATIGFGNAMKGLGASIKGLAAAHPVLLAITIAIGAIAATVKIVDVLTTSFDELKDKISDLKQDILDSQSEMYSISSQLNEINQKIQDIQSLDKLSFTEQEELENLQKQKTELENLYNIEKARHDLKQQKLETTVQDYLNKTFKSEYKTESYTQKQMKNGQFVDVSYTQATNVTKLEEMEAAANEMLHQQNIINKLNKDYNNISSPSTKETKDYQNNLKKAQNARDKAKETALDIQKEAQEQVNGLDESSESYKTVLNASQYLSDTLALLNNDIKSLSDEGKKTYFKNNVQFNDYDTKKEFSNFIDSLNTKELDVIADMYINENTTIDSLKEAIEKLQQEADKNSISLKIAWDDPSSLFEESEDKTQTATLADLKSEASLLSSIKEQLSENGKISVDSMKSITEEYPEAKKALSDFLQGIITQQELYDELEKIYQKDTDEYINHLAEESAKDTEFWEAVYNNSSEVQSILGKMYDGDKANFETVTEAKEFIHKRFTNTLKKNYAEYMKFVVQGEDGLYKLQPQPKDEEILPSNIHPGDSSAAEILSEADNLFSNKTAINEINKLIENLNNETSAIDKAVEERLRKNLDLLSDLDGSKSNSSSSTAKSYDLIERAVENLRRKMTSLKNTTDDTFASWSDRNEALINQIQTTTEQIELQQKAYDKYMQLANSTGLSDYYKNLIQNGAIDEIPISNKNLQEQIDGYKDYYDKAIAASEAVDELKSSLNELEKSKMDIISNEINKVKEQITSAINLIDGYIELAETSGLFASEDLYKQLIENYQKYLSNLYTEREKLNKQFEASVISGKIKEGTESWYDMQSQINEVNEAILDTIVNIKDMSNQLMNLNFEKFEYMQGKIENLTSEADFYLNLIESMDKALYTENGNFTDHGITATGLHAQNLNTYLQQADDYAKKLADIESEIANDPLNNNLTDKKQEYIEAQREAVLSAQDERNAIADLVKDGYDKQLDSLSDLISKYKDLMSAQKDAYDYEKQMSEKAETLASLKKQYEAWKGDTSEEGMKVRQELEVQIKDAQEDIQESEYDKLISDTEKLLDNLQDEYETLINERIDNIDSELQNITSSVNENASIIAGVLEELSNDTGLPLTDAILNIWNDAQPVTDINSSVDNVNDTLSGTNEAIQGLRDDVKNILSHMEKEIEDTKAEIANGNANNTGNNGISGNNSSGSTPLSPANGSNSSNSSAASNNSSNSSNSYDWSIYKHYYSQKLNTDTSVVDRLKSNNIDASFEARSQYWDRLIREGTYKSTYDQNVKLLNWLKNNGYANGTKSAAKGWHLFDENALGSEVILTKQGVLKQFEGGEHVFDAQATENLWKLAQINPDRLIPDLKLNTSLPEMAERNVSNNVDIHIEQIVANDPAEFATKLNQELANNPKTKKIMEERVLGDAFSHNSLCARRFL